MRPKTLLYNARIYTQAAELRVDSLAVYKDRIAAIGNHLEKDPDFRTYTKLDLRGRTVIPGLVDAHTHFYYLAVSLGRVQLDSLASLDACLNRIRDFSDGQPRDAWIVGDGYAPDRFIKRIEPDRFMLDSVTGGRPAFLFSKDQHSAWVNSRALEICGITKSTDDPDGGRIERLSGGDPSGILREGPAYMPVFARIPQPPRKEIDRRYRMALQLAYQQGVTGVHSFDGPEAFTYFTDLAEHGNTGIRINYYPAAKLLPTLLRNKTYYGTGTEFFRIAGIKIFADGSLGSQTALCFDKYIGSKNNYGIETTTVSEIKRLAKEASRLGLPCAVHAIGDRAVSNVLDALADSPRLSFSARHRIEHLQLIRRKDIRRLKQLNIIASMQPSHCPSDIPLIRKYWDKRGANAYIIRTLIDKGIDLAFGSDAPIEPLHPIHGIAAAVRRARPGSRDIFYPEQRLTASEALFRFTVGPAIAAGHEHCRGYLLPGYPADFVILDQDITRITPTKLYDLTPLATILDGTLVWHQTGFRL
ncbi:MAG: amidohydrolase [Candidatus Zixiibacteriota bacterium]